MKRLKGVIQRTCADHRRTDGRRSRAFQEALHAHFGPMPAIALPLVREAARLDLELRHAGAELEAAHARKRRRDIARLRRVMTPMRGQLGRLLEQIEALAKSRKLPNLTDYIHAANQEDQRAG